MSRSRIKRIGILTGGGDCPGLNAVIRGVAKAAIRRSGAEMVGILDGFQGLVERRVIPLDWEAVSGILTQGGTILGTNNKADPFRYPVPDGQGKTAVQDVSDAVVKYIREIGLDILVCIGGDGTMTIAHQMSLKGIPIVGVPKTIDNDIAETDITFGFNSAMTTAAEAIDKIHSTAMSHHRVMIVEVMGRYAGWLALESGLAAGGDVILVPEIPFRISQIAAEVRRRSEHGRKFSIIVAAEGARPEGGEMIVRRTVADSPDPVRLGGIGQNVAEGLEEATGLECRVTVLGHLQRGGVPTPFDRVLSTRFGVKAAELCVSGASGVMVALRGREIIAVPLSRVDGKTRTIPPDHKLIEVAREVGTCFGD